MTDAHDDFLRRIKSLYDTPVWAFDSMHQPPSVNALLMHTAHTKQLVKTATGREYNAKIDFELRKSIPQKPFEGVAIVYLINFKDKRLRDLGNHEKAVTDALVRNRVIAEDNHQILKSNHLLHAPDLPKGVRVRTLIYQQTQEVKR